MIGLPDQNERKSKSKHSVSLHGLAGEVSNRPLFSPLGILKIHLNGETLHDDFDFDELAERTENYSGADLKGQSHFCTQRAWNRTFTLQISA